MSSLAYQRVFGGYVSPSSFAAAAGGPTAPSFGFSGEATGWYKPSAGVMGLTLLGSEALEISANAGYCRLQSKTGAGNSNGFFLYSGANALIALLDSSNGIVVRAGGIAASPTNNNNAGAGEVFWDGSATHGETGRLKSISALTTLSGSSTNLLSIPAGALVLAVVSRVTTAITQSAAGATWTLGDAGTANGYGNSLANALGTTTDNTTWTLTGPKLYAAASNLIATPTAANTFTAGAVRATVFYVTANAPAS